MTTKNYLSLNFEKRWTQAYYDFSDPDISDSDDSLDEVSSMRENNADTESDADTESETTACEAQQSVDLSAEKLEESHSNISPDMFDDKPKENSKIDLLEQQESKLLLVR